MTATATMIPWDEGPLVLLIGPPAAGKSTVATGLLRAAGPDRAALVSTDDLREELTGSPGDTSRDRAVFATAQRRTAEHLAAARPVVVDATSLWPRRRRRWHDLARHAGRPAVAVRVDAPLHVLLERNVSRGREVPPGGVVLMKRQMETAATAEHLLAEGFLPVLEIRTG